jgi:uncharacterized tellurite resistance protein B-like protein
MIYVGRNLAGISQWQGVEPALIDPNLPVDSIRRDLQGQDLTYWPSYERLSPQGRGAFLSWAAGGRRDPNANIGYVFLFFYGLERRLLADAAISPAAQIERPHLIAEIERLLSIYGANDSFHSYAGLLLDVLKASASVLPLYLQAPPVGRTGNELPASLRLGLAQLAKDGKPIPTRWAWSWVVCHPLIYLRTPATRCLDEFKSLFDRRYQERFGQGMVIKPNKTKLKLTYRPASASFGGLVELPVADLPDVTILSGPLARLRELVDQCSDDLDAYSRWLGRNPDSRGSLGAAALLPADLMVEAPGIRAARSWAQGKLGAERRAVMDADEVIALWPDATRPKMTKTEAVTLSQLFEKLGYGIEPDVRFGGPALEAGASAVLFQLPRDAPSAPSAAYSAAMLVLHLGVAVAYADDAVAADEERQLEAHVEFALHLSDGERERLKAHLQWLLAAKPAMAGLKKRVGGLDTAQRTGLRRILVSVAAADGHVGPEEVKTLTKLYTILGLVAADVYSDVHAAASSGTAPAAEPVTVQRSANVGGGFAIPPPAAPEEVPPVTIRLDKKRIEETIAETATVASLLSNIFTDDEASAPAIAVTSAMIPGLDTPHAALTKALAERERWARAELEDLAAKFGLLPDGALDTINELALERCDEPLCDGDDPLEINPRVAKELLG